MGQLEHAFSFVTKAYEVFFMSEVKHSQWNACSDTQIVYDPVYTAKLQQRPLKLAAESMSMTALPFGS